MLIVLTLLSTLSLAMSISPAAAETGTSAWNNVAPMSIARGSSGVAAVNGKIYAIGGINGSSFPLNDNEEYSPVTNTWKSRAAMPTPRSGVAVAVYQNRIYVFGGTVGNGYVGNNEVYDPATNSWQTKASMPTPRADLCANVVNDKIYLIGGKRYSNVSPYSIETGINEIYDPASDTWSTGTSMPTPLEGYGSAVVDNSIYFLGGSRQPNSLSNTVIVNNNQVYDAVNDNWSKAASLKEVSSYGAAAATEGYLAPQNIYYAGGYSADVFSSQTQVFNLSNNSWNYIEAMSTSRAYLGLVVVKDILYAIGGFDGTNWLDTAEQYTPAGYGAVPPKVVVTSPGNRTYQQVTLDFSVNRAIFWMGYSVDGRANITLGASTKLLGLSQGGHYVTIYANDSMGNMGASATVYFSVDMLGPRITVLSPQNQSYDSTDVQLLFTIDEAAKYLAYSLDSQDTVTILGNVTLPALSDGSHRITVYATDDLGNTSDQKMYFTIATFPTVLVVAALVIIIIALAAAYIFFKTKK